MKYYIFGLQRSGTSFLESLLSNNFDCSIANSEGTRKHKLDKSVIRDALVFNIYKNPYTWIESIIYRDPADLLVTSPRLLNDGYNLGHDKVNLVELCKLYDEYVTSWYPTGVFIKYESLIIDSHREYLLNSFNYMLKLKRTNNEWIIPKAGSLFMSESFKENIIPYYIQQKPSQLSNSDIEIINSTISDRTFYLLKYPKVS